MKKEKIINILKWACAILVTSSLVFVMAVMLGYYYWGFEPMALINAVTVYSLFAIGMSMVYFVAIAVDWIRAWREERLERIEEAEWDAANN